MPDPSQPLPGMSRTPRDGDGRGDGRTLAQRYPLAAAPAWLRWSRCPQSPVSPTQGVPNPGCPTPAADTNPAKSWLSTRTIRQFWAIFGNFLHRAAAVGSPLWQIRLRAGAGGKDPSPLTPKKPTPISLEGAISTSGRSNDRTSCATGALTSQKAEGGKAGPAPPGPPRHRVPPALKEPFHSYHFFFSIFAFFFLNRSLSEIGLFFFFFFNVCLDTK